MTDELKHLLRRDLRQYENVLPKAIASGSFAQTYYFVDDATHDIRVLAGRIEALEARNAELEGVVSKFLDFSDSEYVPNSLFDRARFLLKGTDE